MPRARIGLEVHAVNPSSIEDGVFLNQDKTFRALLRMVARIAAKGRLEGRAGKGSWQAFSPSWGRPRAFFVLTECRLFLAQPDTFVPAVRRTVPVRLQNVMECGGIVSTCPLHVRKIRLHFPPAVRRAGNTRFSGRVHDILPNCHFDTSSPVGRPADKGLFRRQFVPNRTIKFLKIV